MTDESVQQKITKISIIKYVIYALTQPIPSYAEISCIKKSGSVSNWYHSNGPMENPTIIHNMRMQ